MKTQIKIKTWRCPDCDYLQDFDADNQELMALHFPNVEVGHCPACFTGKCPDRICKKTLMQKETRPEKKVVITIMGEDESDTHEVPDGQDEQGNEKKRNLTLQEKEEYRKKIQADIIRFKALEDL